jgi:beta-xylosidase
MYRRGQRFGAGAGSRFTGRRGTLRLTNRHHDVNLAFRPEGGAWLRLDTTYETSGYHHNVFGGFLDLRMALVAFGQGEARFRNLTYQVSV